MIINKSGVAIRMGMDEMRVMGRNTQGVKVINLKKNDEIAAIAKVEMDKEVIIDEEIDESLTDLPTEHVDSARPDFSDQEQTGNNAFTNIGDPEVLQKIEDEEAAQNDEPENDKDSEDESAE